ncbi:uncharacterized protein V6R79_010711 [Siganus canaliculatus]
MEDADQNIHLRNLSLQQAANEEEALNLLFLGDTNRMIAETPMNQASTRSHCIFTVHLCRREPGSPTLQRSKLHLVDLAGSDRVSRNGPNGQLLTETKFINLSLHYLEQVIIALSEKNRSHIPYRNSMLTSVLRDSLGGNCMTTMIATMAVEKSNLGETISTCRFAQHVALIKNEARQNEELDPDRLIAHLKREIHSLKEELAMMTGEQRDDRLTVEEIQKLEELVKAFLDDPDPDVTLSLGPDMRKIQYCFSLLKKIITEKPEQRGNSRPDGQRSLTATGSKEETDNSHHGEEEMTKLHNMLKQRDDEISVLVKMLKKEKKRVQDSAPQLANINNGQTPASTSDVGSTVTDSQNGSRDVFSSEHGSRAEQHMKKGPQLSMGKQEAFEMFVRDHEDHLTIEDNKNLLRQRSTEAKRLGEQLNEAKTRITELKKQLATQRRQRAAHGVIESHTAAEDEVDPVEENLCKHIEQEKRVCKSTIGRLKGLRTEIEHLQLLLEKAKVKLQRDFHRWWSQEASSVQESEAPARRHTESPHRTLKPSSPGTPSSLDRWRTIQDSPAPYRGPSTSSAQDLSLYTKSKPSLLAAPTQVRRESDSTPSSELRSLSYASVPLTGDQQADADILAFIRARQNLLNRTGR